LTWFPKDNISGSFDINNQHVEAGFQASTAGGKYYCLGAKGNKKDTNGQQLFGSLETYEKELGNVVVTFDENDVGQNGNLYDRKKKVLDLDPNSPVYRDEIDYILIKASGNGDWFPANQEAKFFIRNGLLTKYDGGLFSVAKRDGEVIQNPQIFTGEASLPFGRYVWSDGRDREDKNAWIMRYDDGETDTEGKPAFQFADPEAAGFSDLLQHSTDFNTQCREINDLRNAANNSINGGGDNFQGTDNTNPAYAYGCLKVDADDWDDGCAIKVNFADSDGRLNRINFVCYTGQREQERVSFNVTVGLREPCVNIAQTEEQTYGSIGWTDRLWKGSKYSLNNLNYKYDLPANPFGSLGLLSNIDGSQSYPLVSIYSHFNNFDVFDTPPAVFGSPYSCGGANKFCLETNYKNDTGVYTPLTGFDGKASEKNITSGKNSLSQIFAKISSVWNWLAGANGSSYTKNTITALLNEQEDEDVNPYNVTESLSNSNKAPKVRPLGNCKSGDKCLEINTPGMTVNGKSSGDLIFPTDVAKVNLKFYGYADKDQMPIRKIKVDWGDDTVVDLDGYFRNQRGKVNVQGQCIRGVGKPDKTCHLASGQFDENNAPIYFDSNERCVTESDCVYMDGCFPENNAPNFGQIANKTCDNTYFKFDHVYQCVKGDQAGGWKEGSFCSNSEMRTLYGGCCEFTPAVQLKDNWGWCNGKCGEVGSPGNEGCYESECSVSSGAFTTSSIKIIVPPNL
jgi:hypothetical protein